MVKIPDNVWEYIQSLYQKYFDIPPRIVDLIALDEMFKMCAEGKSNAIICMALETEDWYVEKVLTDFLGFPGWKFDLDISPLSVYNSLNGDYAYYVTTIKTVSSLTTRKDIDRSFNVCRTYNKLRKEVLEYVK